MAEQVLVRETDLGWITITSVDPTVTIQRSAISAITIPGGGTTLRPAFAAIHNATLPVIGVLFDMDTSDAITANRYGVLLWGASRGCVLPGAGVINAGERGLVVETGSIFHGQLSVWSGAGSLGVRVSNGAVAYLRAITSTGAGVNIGNGCVVNLVDAVLTGCVNGINATGQCVVGAYGVNVSNASEQGILAGAGSVVYAENVNASGCKYGLWAEKGATISAPGANCSNATFSGIYAIDASTINATNATVNNCGGSGVHALQGAMVNFRASTATGCVRSIYAQWGARVNADAATLTGAGTNGVRADNGSRVNLSGAACEKVPGVPSSLDIVITTGSQINAHGATGGLNVTKNTISSSGVIFAA